MRRVFVFFLVFLLPLQLLDETYVDSVLTPAPAAVAFGIDASACADILASCPQADEQKQTSPVPEPDLSDSLDVHTASSPGRFAVAHPAAGPPVRFENLVYTVLEPPRA
ncbi:hypothetical protein FOZ76_06020 [Verticiella sediminum]|uniref:Uncharacterized protein n=1 Tax=Verticiella sediminum TaxID=1247510 RepID=A0A556AYC1_9BURK|nr:hypothetical protein [Verticiella sediminum]TSH97465.1 hypothetical protein FOZ76_06020 [Verticiella sediminum]